MFIIIGILLGLMLGLFWEIQVPPELVPYLSTFILVGLDALIAGYIALQNRTFQMRNFAVKLSANVAAAMLLTALGIQLKFDFALVIAAIFAYRIFTNLGETAEILLARRKAARDKKLERTDEQ